MFVWSRCKNVFFQYALLCCVMILLVIKCRTRWCIVRWNLAKEVSAPVERAAPLQAYPYKPRRKTGIQHPVRHNNFILGSEMSPGIHFHVVELLQLFFWLSRSGVLVCTMQSSWMPYIRLTYNQSCETNPSSPRARAASWSSPVQVTNTWCTQLCSGGSSAPGGAENCCSFTSGKGKLQCNSKPSQDFWVRLWCISLLLIKLTEVQMNGELY